MYDDVPLVNLSPDYPTEILSTSFSILISLIGFYFSGLFFLATLGGMWEIIYQLNIRNQFFYIISQYTTKRKRTIISLLAIRLIINHTLSTQLYNNIDLMKMEENRHGGRVKKRGYYAKELAQLQNGEDKITRAKKKELKKQNKDSCKEAR